MHFASHYDTIGDFLGGRVEIPLTRDLGIENFLFAGITFSFSDAPIL
jgi:hypothetical protein